MIKRKHYNNYRLDTHDTERLSDVIEIITIRNNQA